MKLSYSHESMNSSIKFDRGYSPPPSVFSLYICVCGVCTSGVCVHEWCVAAFLRDLLTPGIQPLPIYTHTHTYLHTHTHTHTHTYTELHTYNIYSTETILSLSYAAI